MHIIKGRNTRVKAHREIKFSLQWTAIYLLIYLQSICSPPAMRSSRYRYITWGLMQLLIRQHLHIMSTADRLFMKSHQEDEDKNIQLRIKNKWWGRWTWASRVVKRLVAQVPIASLVACCSNNKKVRVCQNSTMIFTLVKCGRTILSVAVLLCWRSWWSCWRAQWPCRSKCWEGKAFWWLDTCWRRSVKRPAEWRADLLVAG